MQGPGLRPRRTGIMMSGRPLPIGEPESRAPGLAMLLHRRLTRMAPAVTVTNRDLTQARPGGSLSLPPGPSHCGRVTVAATVPPSGSPAAAALAAAGPAGARPGASMP